jgi:hypothetical protein
MAGAQRRSGGSRHTATSTRAKPTANTKEVRTSVVRQAQRYGCEEPRRFTPPLRKLTRKTSLGFEAIEFIEEVLCIDLLPWQQWWLIHALELDENGDFRFRTLLTLVARQNGKTHLLKCLALFFMFEGYARLVLGTAQTADIARESWDGAVDIVEGDRELKAEIAPGGIRRANGEQQLKLRNGARYKIAATTRKAGRSLSVDLLILDELREHRDWLAWGALSKTTQARPNALIVGISNAGDEQSVVLNQLHDAALSERDSSLFLAEWSAPDNCELDDMDAVAQANPALGHYISEKAILSNLATDPPEVYRTEVLCQRVDVLDAGVDLTAWRDCGDPSGTMDELRDKVVACVDVAPDGNHVTLVAAAPVGDKVRVEVVAAWDTTDDARKELPDVLADVSPRALAWYPNGPAAALAGVLKGGTFTKRLGDKPPVQLNQTEAVQACMGFSDLVKARRVLHNGDPLLTAHVSGAKKLNSGEGWRFVRRGAGSVDAAYAAAGAVHVALTVPEEAPLPKPMIV